MSTEAALPLPKSAPPGSHWCAGTAQRVQPCMYLAYDRYVGHSGRVLWLCGGCKNWYAGVGYRRAAVNRCGGVG